MGAKDFFSPKSVANRQKAKGLQKLRWYCQARARPSHCVSLDAPQNHALSLCQKQCRDENGFKCHATSEGHLRQMAIFGQHANKVVGDYSEEFERRFLEHCARSHRNTRVTAQLVYNEYIADKEHIHMNATRWTTLTGFITDLARRGVITVEETPKGLMMVYKPRDAEEALRDAKNAQREKAAEAEADREERMLAEAIERARKKARLDGGDGGDPADAGDAQGGAPPQELVRRDDGGAGVTLSLAAARGSVARPRLAVDEDDGPGGATAPPTGGQAHPSAVASLIADDLAAKDAADRRTKDWWLAHGIVVKIMARELTSHGLYKAKGAVTGLVDRYTAEVTVPASEPGGGAAPAVVRVDQAHLETVLPRPGGTVRILRGGARGCDGRLVSVDEARFKAKVRVVQPRGPLDGKELELDYEDISKVAAQ